MPSTFRKSILSVGKHHSPDGVLDVTPERLKHFADSFKRMTKAGAVVPISWDHATEMKGLVPMSAANYKRSAKNTIGKLSDIAVAADGSGAEITVEITDPTAQGRAERNEVFVSPVILDRWRDGKGSEWKDVITHVDLVNHPVDATQQPFSPVAEGALACALRLGLNTNVYRMATEDDELDDELDDNEPLEDGIDDELDDNEPLEDGIDDGLPAADVPPPPPPAPAADKPALEEVLSALKALVGMLQALKPATPEATPEEPGDTNFDTGVDLNQPLNTPDPGYLAMSTTASNQANAAFVYAQQQHREKIASRLESLLANGQCSAEEYHERKKHIGGIRLSLTAKGTPRSGELEQWIASREAVPNGAFWDMTKRTTRLAVVPLPKGVNGQLTEDEENKLVDFALGRKAKA